MAIIDSVKKIFKSGMKTGDHSQDFATSMEEKADFMSEEELVSFVTGEFTRRQKERLPFELQWRLNINFVEGNQYLDINPFTNSIEEVPKISWWQERGVYNHIAPIMETRLAKLSRLSPIIKCRPASSSKEDISAAKVTNKVVENTYSEHVMRDRQLELNNWSEICGTAVLKNVWDDNEGRQIVPGFNEGDIAPTVCSPFEIFPDSPFSTGIDDCESIIHAKAYHVNDIKKIWGKDVEGSDINVFTLKEHANIMGGLNSHTGGYSVGSQKKKDHSIVYEYWERPTEEFPSGRLIICTDDEMLLTSELPYQIGRNGEPDLPFVLQRCIVRVNCFFGKSIIERLIPIQRDYNALKNRMKEYLNRASIGQLVYEEGSIDEDWLETEGLAPGAMIPVRKGAQFPTYMNYHPLPQTFELEEDRLMQQFIIISGVSEISRDSSAPTGVNSGVALAILQEQDDTRLSLTAKHIDTSIIKTAKMWIRLYQQYADFPRILRSVGKNNEVDVVEWLGSSLTSDDIYIETGTQLSESPAQRKQMVFDLINSGLFNDPETGALSKAGRSKIFEMLEMGNWEQFDTETELQIEKARRENRIMNNGEMPEVADYDDDVTHLEWHNQQRLTSDYEENVQENPAVAEAYAAHVDMHIQQLQAKVQPQGPMEGPPPGGPEEPPPGPTELQMSEE